VTVSVTHKLIGAFGRHVATAAIPTARPTKAYRAVVHTADRDFLRFADIHCYFPLDS
jgi:hypothetical protein